ALLDVCAFYGPPLVRAKHRPIGSDYLRIVLPESRKRFEILLTRAVLPEREDHRGRRRTAPCLAAVVELGKLAGVDLLRVAGYIVVECFPTECARDVVRRRRRGHRAHRSNAGGPATARGAVQRDAELV